MTRYQDYFKTKHWKELKEDLLFKRGTECFVCGKWSTLLLHHVSYKNLFKEKLQRDLFILCFDCHNRAHFWTIFKIKVPLKRNWLLFSLYSRKLIFCTLKRQFRLSLLYFFSLLFMVCAGIVKIVFTTLFSVLGYFLKRFLKYSLAKINIVIVK